jgi:hypothetical protein
MEKYRVEYAELHPTETDLPAVGHWHSRLRGAETKDEAYFFSQQFTDSMAQHVVDSTNKEGREFQCATNAKKWRPMAIGEFFCVLGIGMYMGLVQLPSKEDYWSPGELNVVTPVPEYMSFERFNILTREMLTTLEIQESQPAKDSPSFDKLWRIRPLLTLFALATRLAYTMGRFVAVDEMMVKFKGRCPIKCYMPKKPTKWGMKIWAVCCSVTGYLWMFSVYAGLNVDDGSEMSGKIGEKIVLNLTEELPVRAPATNASYILVPSAQTDATRSVEHVMHCRSEPTGIADVARSITVTLL